MLLTAAAVAGLKAVLATDNLPPPPPWAETTSALAEPAPENAADILSQLDDIAVAKIMVFMKDADTAGRLCRLEQFARTEQLPFRVAA